jgi:hypothetical protein
MWPLCKQVPICNTQFFFSLPALSASLRKLSSDTRYTKHFFSHHVEERERGGHNVHAVLLTLA